MTLDFSYSKNKPESIKALFNDIAPHYEKGNAIISLQTYRLWNRSLIKHALKAKNPKSFLDLCAGTGDIALPYLRKKETPCTAYLLDFSKEMLAVAKKKANHEEFTRHKITFIEGDAQQIPLSDKEVEVVTVAYGIRNIEHPILCYEETYRVLAHGGTFGILELTRPNNPLLRLPHHLYLKLLLPILGHSITSNKEAYQYLCDSIHHFVSPNNVISDLQKIGFIKIRKKSLLGGIATLVLAEKN